MSRHLATRRQRIRAGAGATAVGGLIAFASPVFACSLAMGNLIISPSSGPAGTVVTTSATGMKPYPAKYEMHFANVVGDNCMSFTGVTVIKTLHPNMNGQWNNVKVKIPMTATQGTHGFCGMEIYPQKGVTGTIHDSFTVT